MYHKECQALFSMKKMCAAVVISALRVKCLLPKYFTHMLIIFVDKLS